MNYSWIIDWYRVTFCCLDHFHFIRVISVSFCVFAYVCAFVCVIWCRVTFCCLYYLDFICVIYVGSMHECAFLYLQTYLICRSIEELMQTYFFVVYIFLNLMKSLNCYFGDILSENCYDDFFCGQVWRLQTCSYIFVHCMYISDYWLISWHTGQSVSFVSPFVIWIS